MLWERRLHRWAAGVRERIDIPVRLILWDGEHLDFGNFVTPRVALHAKSTAVLPFLLKPSLDNLGEAYIRGMVDLEGKLADVIHVGYALAQHTLSGPMRFDRLARHFRHTRRSDKQAIQYHYDVSNAFYRLWLDPDMVYSCAYFENGDEDLHTAQLKKIDHILTKIKLRPGQSLLDIGCGWGALVLRAAQKYGARCVGITLSQNQYDYARARVEAAGLGDRIDIRLQDYRDVEGRFDRITSVGMFEHVGRKNLPRYFTRIRDLLEDDGLAMNHGITSTHPGSGGTALGAAEFIEKYVFPAGELPHLSLALRAMQEGGLEALDVENLRRHYVRTLSLWAENFEQQSERIRQEVDDRKYRIWRLYLAGCAHAFHQDDISIYQVVCRKSGRHADTLDWSRRHIYA